MNKELYTVMVLLGAGFAAMVLCGASLVVLVGVCLKRGMKLETIVIIAKAWCFIMIGFFTPLTVGLAQWANSGEFPGPIVWVVMCASCIVGAAGQLLSFLSGSYADYAAGRKPVQPGFDTQQFTKSPPAQPGQAAQ